ncbi:MULTISPECIES: c-type cytochrome [unclassified Roseovarius]|jgi:mono/diheme cytochrome c family protein|uniref:c-type cytochrome n=1 Tax=unclassified Roseovarius TaxID=2614913 RepID=UPI0000685DB2|nr:MULTISPECIES: cytochrome c [unclassified Roseovarius]EAQ26509.1 cytochrome c family protein [Roseovarius sp. 217]KJS40165.1 MAG: cytochrome C [Roseovarius sp. BRH_c41]
MRATFCTLTLVTLSLMHPAQAQDTRAGEQTFERYCAACHGLDATGMGPMQVVLSVQPTDLTMLQAKNNGQFPVERVVRRIDGRDPLVSHGSPMPIYGSFFEDRDIGLMTERGQTILTSQPVVDLVTYLQGLQKS